MTTPRSAAKTALFTGLVVTGNHGDCYYCADYPPLVPSPFNGRKTTSTANPSPPRLFEFVLLNLLLLILFCTHHHTILIEIASAQNTTTTISTTSSTPLPSSTITTIMPVSPSSPVSPVNSYGLIIAIVIAAFICIIIAGLSIGAWIHTKCNRRRLEATIIQGIPEEDEVETVVDGVVVRVPATPTLVVGYINGEQPTAATRQLAGVRVGGVHHGGNSNPIVAQSQQQQPQPEMSSEGGFSSPSTPCPYGHGAYVPGTSGHIVRPEFVTAFTNDFINNHHPTDDNSNNNSPPVNYHHSPSNHPQQQQLQMSEMTALGTPLFHHHHSNAVAGVGGGGMSITSSSSIINVPREGTNNSAAAAAGGGEDADHNPFPPPSSRHHHHHPPSDDGGMRCPPSPSLTDESEEGGREEGPRSSRRSGAAEVDVAPAGHHVRLQQQQQEEPVTPSTDAMARLEGRRATSSFEGGEE